MNNQDAVTLATSSTTWLACEGEQNSLVAASYDLLTAVSGQPTTPYLASVS